MHERLNAVVSALNGEPRTAVEIVPTVYDEPLTQLNANWRLSETLSYLGHLEVAGRVTHEPDGAAERWRLA